MKIEKIRLASASPRRRELIKYLGYPVEILVTNAEEHSEATDEKEKAMDISKAKALASANERKPLPGELIIAADTMVFANGEAFGKPKDRQDATRMLEAISGREHHVVTGVTFCFVENGEVKNKSFAELTKVFVKPLTNSEINEYLDIGEYRDKAGSYAIQGVFSKHIEGIEGDYNNVVGLPVSRIYREIILLTKNAK